MSNSPNPSDPGVTTPPPATPASEPSPAAPGGDPSLLNKDNPAPVELFDPETFTAPDGLNAEHDTYKNFVEYAKEIGMPKAQAEKLVGIHAAAVKATTEALTEQWKNQQTAWAETIKADPEIGNLAVVRSTVASLMDNSALSDPKFREALDFTGAGNHPAIVRTLFRWAKALSEGASISGDPAKRDQTGNVDTRPSPAVALYGPNGPHTGGPKI